MFNPARTRVGDFGWIVTSNVISTGYMVTEIPVHVVSVDDDEIVLEHNLLRGARWTLPADGKQLNDDLSMSRFENKSAELRKILWPGTTFEKYEKQKPWERRGISYTIPVIFDRQTGMARFAENTQIKEIDHDAESKEEENKPKEKTGDVR